LRVVALLEAREPDDVIGPDLALGAADDLGGGLPDVPRRALANCDVGARVALPGIRTPPGMAAIWSALLVASGSSTRSVRAMTNAFAPADVTALL